MRWITAMVVVSLGLSAAAMAQQTGKTKMYKWTDENGTVHYSAKPDEQVQAEELELRRGPRREATQPEVVVDSKEVARCQMIRDSVRNLEGGSDTLEIQADDGSTRPMTASISRSIKRCSSEMKEIAIPERPARPVLPIR